MAHYFILSAIPNYLMQLLQDSTSSTTIIGTLPVKFMKYMLKLKSKLRKWNGFKRLYCRNLYPSNHL